MAPDVARLNSSNARLPIVGPIFTHTCRGPHVDTGGISVSAMRMGAIAALCCLALDLLYSCTLVSVQRMRPLFVVCVTHVISNGFPLHHLLFHDNDTVSCPKMINCCVVVTIQALQPNAQRWSLPNTPNSNAVNCFFGWKRSKPEYLSFRTRFDPGGGYFHPTIVVP
jgi:hypothetical protein